LFMVLILLKKFSE